MNLINILLHLLSTVIMKNCKLSDSTNLLPYRSIGLEVQRQHLSGQNQDITGRAVGPSGSL